MLTSGDKTRRCGLRNEIIYNLRSTFLRPLTKSGASRVISNPPNRMLSTHSTPTIHLQRRVSVVAAPREMRD